MWFDNRVVMPTSCDRAPQQSTGAMRVQRLHMHRAIPPRANDIGKPFSIVLVSLVDLHLERSASVPRVEADHVETAVTELMDQPRRHRSRLDTNFGIMTGMAADGGIDLIRARRANTAPNPVAVRIDDTDRRCLLRYVQAYRMGHCSPPIIRKPPGQCPDRGIIGTSHRRRDYPMSTHGPNR